MLYHVGSRLLPHRVHQPKFPEALSRPNVVEPQGRLDHHRVLSLLAAAKPDRAIGAVGAGTVVSSIAVALLGPRVEIDAADDAVAVQVEGFLVRQERQVAMPESGKDRWEPFRDARRVSPFSRADRRVKANLPCQWTTENYGRFLRITENTRNFSQVFNVPCKQKTVALSC
jgi:hypothetical protein